MANELVEKVGEELLKKKEFIKHLIIRKEVKNGFRFTEQELNDLHECCKHDYFEEILAYSD
jgi:hypothetical protein